MDRSQTVRFPNVAATQELETSPEAQERPCQTVVFSDILAKDAGSSALEKLDALSSLVQQETRRDDRRPSGAPSENAPVESEESLDDYVKQFMERMTGKKEEVISTVQSVQPLPTVAPAAPADARHPARAPECSESLHRMRDLANASSRSAMHAHQSRQLSSSTLATFLPAALASLASSFLAVVSAATGSAWCQTSSVALLAVALALAWRFWTTSRKHLQIVR